MIESDVDSIEKPDINSEDAENKGKQSIPFEPDKYGIYQRQPTWKQAKRAPQEEAPQSNGNPLSSASQLAADEFLQPPHLPIQP